MKTAIIIPARYHSTRLPGKPLLNETGMYLIQHTVLNAQRSDADMVVVATDDRRIFEAVEGFGGRAVMTSSDHETGSGRIAEAAQNLDADIIVNVQGDEPEVSPETLNKLIEIHKRAMTFARPAFASTLVSPFAPHACSGPGSVEDPSCVKAVLSAKGEGGLRRALYFSRATLPWPRETDGKITEPAQYYLHIGLYAFSAKSLQTFAAAPMGVLEKIEGLEQLRILEMGERIIVEEVAGASPGIDTPEDYAAFVKRMNAA